jgi:hypothetical protein
MEGYKRIATFAKEVGLSPQRLRQLARQSVLVVEDVDGMMYVTPEEQERFKSLKREVGRPIRIPTPNPVSFHDFLRGKKNADTR